MDERLFIFDLDFPDLVKIMASYEEPAYRAYKYGKGYTVNYGNCPMNFQPYRVSYVIN